MLADPFAQRSHVTTFDGPHSQHEERMTIGSYPFDRSKIFLVVWTTRVDAEAVGITRVIGARPMTARERRAYKNEASDR